MTTQECPICLDPLTDTHHSYALTKPCNHAYHLHCVRAWTQTTSSSCPTCRIEISSLFAVNEAVLHPVVQKIGDKHADLVMIHPTEGDVENDNEEDNNVERKHLGNQMCCICDSRVLATRSIICPQCSGLYHLSCSDGLNCPLCEEWIDDLGRSKTLDIRARKVKSRKVRDDSNYYVELVDELQRRRAEMEVNNESNKCEDVAWSALDKVMDASKTVTGVPDLDVPQQHERKLKRPKRAGRSIVKVEQKPLPLTAASLAQLEKPNKDKRLKKSLVDISKKGLSFTQKLLVQRLLLKPRLRDDMSKLLSFDAYTELNKQISHKLYALVDKDPLAISAMNAVIELAEREGCLPFANRKAVDSFTKKCTDNEILNRFINAGWNSNADSDIKQLIALEIKQFL